MEKKETNLTKVLNSTWVQYGLITFLAAVGINLWAAGGVIPTIGAITACGVSGFLFVNKLNKEYQAGKNEGNSLITRLQRERFATGKR